MQGPHGVTTTQISDAGAQSVADALSAGKLPRLKGLRLEGNRIGDAGAEALARAVSGGGAAALKKLVVGENDALYQIGGAVCLRCKAAAVTEV